MLVTVAICTLNRAASLRRTLESLAAMRLPDDITWEVVVVNNGCTDDTDEVVQALMDRLPIRREFEPERGLSRARNRAVDAARGDYIIWTDDDVVVGRGWLAAYGEAFGRWPEAAVFGGPIIPRYTAPVPKWLSDSRTLIGEVVYSARDFGDEPVPLCRARIPYGPNFAVRTTEQRIFRYDIRLGHGPGQRRRAEEKDVIERILASGAAGYWVPLARVEHRVTREQQTVRYFADFCATTGEAEAHLTAALPTAGPRWFGVPRWRWRRLFELWLIYRFHRLISPAPVWLMHLRNYAMLWGMIRYWRSESG
jgi:glycosyltransferase involved in cell wall biosynthesis